MEREEFSWLHALGVGGLTALVVWAGYAVMWLALKLVEWIEGRG